MILLIFALIFIVLAFKYPSSRRLTFFMLLFMWVLYGFNDVNGDYINYYYDYLKIGRGDFFSFSFHEEGYIAIAYICSKFLHMTYQQFVILTSAVSTLFLSFVVTELTPHPNTALALFMINPYWMMICQTRFYMAFLFVLVGYVFLLKYPGRKGVILFLLLILVSGTFHRTGWLCIVLLFSKLNNIFKIALVTGLMAVTVLLFRTTTGMNIALRYIGERKVNTWLAVSAHRSMLGVILLLIIHIGIIYTAIYLYKRVSRVDNQNNICRYLLFGIVIMTAFLPMEFIDKNYERFTRISLFLLYLIYGHYKKNVKVYVQAVPIGIILISVTLLAYYSFYYVSFNGWFIHNLVPILQNNILLP